MICESCQQKLATVHLTEIVQKYKKETHLCEDCARSKGVPYKAQFSVKEFLGGLAKDVSEADAEEAEAPAEVASPSSPAKAAAAAEGQPAEKATSEPCPVCGITFSEFRASGRLGCHHDYEHFKRGLIPLLEKIHHASQHRGRVPSRVGERLERERLLTDYEKDLSEAVEREDYERAAELRDRIREIEERGQSA